MGANAFDAGRLHSATTFGAEIQGSAKRQQRDVARVGPQKERLSKTGLAMPNDRNFMIDHLITVANSTMPDQASLNRVEKIRKLGLFVDDAGCEKDRFGDKFPAFQHCFKAPIRQARELGHSCGYEIGPIFDGLRLHTGEKLDTTDSVRKASMIV